MTENLYIITGASRGLGAAMALRLLHPSNLLLCISRHINPTLTTQAQAVSAPVEQWPRDLSNPAPVAEQLETWLGARDPVRFAEVTLVNNAAVITRVGPLDASANAELANALRVGLEAPVLLTAAFLRATNEWPGVRKVLNISSGLGRRAMAGSAAYCATKAGMDHFSRAVALDEAHRGSRVRIVSLAPGVIDTDMQVSLRAADASGFPDQADFIDLQAKGQLASPDAAAARVLDYLKRADFGSNPIGDVRD
jgi:NAD(P)-dependent dehydrogenase (short-subunit alcohol dehydrogenase family)